MSKNSHPALLTLRRFDDLGKGRIRADQKAQKDQALSEWLSLTAADLDEIRVALTRSVSVRVKPFVRWASYALVGLTCAALAWLWLLFVNAMLRHSPTKSAMLLSAVSPYIACFGAIVFAERFPTWLLGRHWLREPSEFCELLRPPSDLGRCVRALMAIDRHPELAQFVDHVVARNRELNGFDAQYILHRGRELDTLRRGASHAAGPQATDLPFPDAPIHSGLREELWALFPTRSGAAGTESTKRPF